MTARGPLLLSRRAVLAALLSSTAVFLAPPRRVWPREALQAPEVQFVGPEVIQVILHDTLIRTDPPVPVPEGARIRWRRRPSNRLGGLGMLNDQEVNFTGNAHTSAPQMYRPFSQVVPESVLGGFKRPPDLDDVPAQADLPAHWQVMVDGMPSAVKHIYRKTIPTEAVRTGSETRAIGKRHLVSLCLKTGVPSGAEVEVSLRGTGPLPPVGRVTRERLTRSQAVQVCQVGYAVVGPKRGYVGLWLGHDQDAMSGTTDAYLSEGHGWQLVNADSGATIASGGLTLAKSGSEPHMAEVNFNGCDVYEADFSDVVAPGRYLLVIEGIGASAEFPISANPYAEVLRLAARWYYHQRSGIEIAAPYGEGRVRPRNGHPMDGLVVEQTDVQLGRTSEGFRAQPYAPRYLGQLSQGPDNPNAWGGWHDAGDWDRRIQHMDAVHDMALAVELFPSASALALNIPESGRSFSDASVRARRNADDRGDGETVLPDLIHEALWGVSLWRRTQTDDGGIIGGVEYSVDGVEGSVSWNPIQRTFAYAPEEWASYRFVTGAAKLGHVIANVCGDTVLGAQLIAEAEAAWDWAEQARARAEEAETLETGDKIALARARLPAAATLYRANGRSDICDVFEALNPFAPVDPAAAEGIRRSDVAMHAVDYLRAGEEGRTVTPEIAAAITGWLESRQRADRRLGRDYGLHNTNAYRWGPGWLRFGPGSNWRARRAAYAYVLNGGDTEQIGPLVIEGMWFALGCNPSNVSLIQGMGERAFADALVKDLDGYPKVPGQISFGVAGGELRGFEKRRLEGSMYPEAQVDWPIYTQIFESSAAIICAEHGMKSNTMEWLFACLLCNEHLSRQT